jgi:RHS repeat-associated protein
VKGVSPGTYAVQFKPCPTNPDFAYYVTHRYYDPITGEFVSVDPMVNQTHEPYAYASDDPVNSSDPTGLWKWIGWINAPFPTWQAGENWVAYLLAATTGPVDQQLKVNINLKGYSYRVIDVYAVNPGYLNEVKTGSQSRSSPGALGNSQQAKYDSKILAGYGYTINGDKLKANGDVWWFLPNAAEVTKPSGPLIAELQSYGINIIILYYSPKGEGNAYFADVAEESQSKQAPAPFPYCPAQAQDVRPMC